MTIQYETLTQAAERTGISKVTLRRRIASGHLIAYRAGARLIRLRPEGVCSATPRPPKLSIARAPAPSSGPPP